MSYTQGDYLPAPLLEGEKKFSVFTNIIGGIFGYGEHLGGNYGLNFGIDSLVSDSLFVGGYGVILGKTLNLESLQMQNLQFELGTYMRYLLSWWEFDTTLSYSLLNTNTQRSFTLYSTTFSQNATYNTHFLNLEERVGYRFSLTQTDTLKPYVGLALSFYMQPSYQESGNFSYTQNDIFYGAFGAILGAEYRKIFKDSSLYLGASLLCQFPVFGDATYTLQYLDSLLYFENEQDFVAQLQGGVDFTLNPNSYLSVDLSYRYSNTQYFDADIMVGYRHLF